MRHQSRIFEPGQRLAESADLDPSYDSVVEQAGGVHFYADPALAHEYVLAIDDEPGCSLENEPLIDILDPALTDLEAQRMCRRPLSVGRIFQRQLQEKRLCADDEAPVHQCHVNVTKLEAHAMIAVIRSAWTVLAADEPMHVQNAVDVPTAGEVNADGVDEPGDVPEHPLAGIASTRPQLE